MPLVKGRLEAERERQALARQVVAPPPGVTYRPTPTPYENAAMAATGLPVLFKQWDKSPISPDAFDPTQPPGPVVPPVNSALPVIMAWFPPRLGCVPSG